MKRGKIVIPEDTVGLGSDWRTWLKENGYEIISGNGSTDPAYLKSLLRDADAIMARAAVKYTPEILDEANKLKVIARYGVGYDNIDVDYCSKNRVYVCITPNANSKSVAEHAIGLMIACSHQFIKLHFASKAGNWAIRNSLTTHTLFGKTVGVIGFGRIGKRVAHICAEGLEMNVLAYDPFVSDSDGIIQLKMAESIDEVLQQADVVSLHLPYTKAYHNLIDEDKLKMMKKDAILINTARGGFVDEDALYRALKEGWIAGAGMDVRAQEPPEEISPLFELDNIIMTPHCSSLDEETLDRTCWDAVGEIHRVLSGEEPLWAVNDFAV